MARKKDSRPTDTESAYFIYGRSGETLNVACFAFVLEQLPGWVATLAFVKGTASVDLSDVGVTYVAAHLDNDGLNEWVKQRSHTHPPALVVPPGGLTMRRYDSLRLGDLQSRACAELVRLAEAPGMFGAFMNWLGPHWSTAARARTGAAGKPDIHFARLAVAYEELLASGTRSPRKALAEREGLTDTQMRNQLEEARVRELLSRPGRGRAEGQHATNKARRLLAKET